jgi:hypothetical protein
MQEAQVKKQLTKAVCRVACGGGSGTAFLISSNQVITASHCVKSFGEGKEVEVEFRNLSSEPIVCKAIPIGDFLEHSLPVVILELQQISRIPMLIRYSRTPK